MRNETKIVKGLFHSLFIKLKEYFPILSNVSWKCLVSLVVWKNDVIGHNIGVRFPMIGIFNTPLLVERQALRVDCSCNQILQNFSKNLNRKSKSEKINFARKKTFLGTASKMHFNPCQGNFKSEKKLRNARKFSHP